MPSFATLRGSPKAAWILASGLVGAIAFVTGQHLAGFPSDIAQFMGSEIVRRGGYSPALSGPIGWVVHLGVASSYAALYGLVVLAPFFPEPRRARWGTALGLVIVFGFVSTSITGPAIAITLAILSGEGLPSSVPPLNTTLGFVFWNHVIFFFISFAITVMARDLTHARAAAPGAADADSQS